MSDDQGNRLFVGNLPWSTTDQHLLEAFEQLGPVIEAKVIKDHYSGRSRGFGFVTFENSSHAAEAIEKMNGFDMGGRQIRVDRASSQRR
ncbi:Glycine-rich RNA-binding protein RZ1A [Gracilariopsis chorda]|uniref:Glycine-rich RNA-binding protein RZ1A n=1 Tax=Gracilariopsis chorda TaxID=448386 RepID=A0A2V3ITU2_9FLOR|nr:Glycine-rich RNA-binding protein RZ1A [Gracilariopsis chorda]|eukprot:PXF45147.1 Glycine-rich RNA-binding protein RZ1A [Gracilariopsis chorda]